MRNICGISAGCMFFPFWMSARRNGVFIKLDFAFKIIVMKRFLILLSAFIMLLPLHSGIVLRDGLFSSEEELASFRREDVREDEEEFYEGMKIYLLTGGEGSAIWENFGHSAFVIECGGNSPVAFDYGIFTFDETFIPNFILGKLYYEVWETWALYRIADLESADRTVSLLELELDSSQKKALYSFLVYNTEEENRTYLYDYFSDNCATRLRDIYSWATGGEFESWLKSQKSGETIRTGVARHLSHSTFFSSWIINYLLGASVDRETTRWEDCYLPSALEKAVEEYQETESSVLYETQKRKATPGKWPFVFYSFLFGLALLLLSFAASYMKHHGAFDFLLGIVFTFFGLMSLLLIFFSFFTIHYVTHDNLNILLITPLCLVQGVLHFMSIGKRRMERALHKCALVMDGVLVAVVIVRLVFPAFLIQNIWAPAVTAFLLYTAEALPLLVKRK